jgi:hypothetical protein
MNIPGFTAQASLYQTGGYRRMPSHRSGWSNPATVVPQLPRQLNLLQCLQGCSLAGADAGCVDTCYRMEHIGASDDFAKGGKSGGSRREPELVCGPCRAGRQRCFLPGVGVSTGPCID